MIRTKKKSNLGYFVEEYRMVGGGRKVVFFFLVCGNRRMFLLLITNYNDKCYLFSRFMFFGKGGIVVYLLVVRFFLVRRFLYSGIYC